MAARRTPDGRAPAVALGLVRIAAGAVFIAFGVGKFTSHATELASFRGYGLPDFSVYLIGLVELLGGVLLVGGLFTRVASLVLAGNMVGAIVVSGLLHDEMISLTLAPALLLVMLVLVWRGPGGWAVRGRA
ncbi:MAG: DoxX family membrane protein [Actinobacteria bacterium]|nr:DoxX family membrane protein [Actinomycetota bacterium]